MGQAGFINLLQCCSIVGSRRPTYIVAFVFRKGKRPKGERQTLHYHIFGGGIQCQKKILNLKFNGW